MQADVLPDFEAVLELERKETVFQSRSVRVLGVALALGVVGNWLFFDMELGLNIGLYITLVVGTAFALLHYFKRPVVLHHAVFALPAVVFALLLGVRLAPPLFLFNGMMLAGSLFVVVRYTGTPKFLGGHWTILFRDAIRTAMISWVEGPMMILSHSTGWLKDVDLDNRHLANAKAVLRGLAITLPVLLIFGLLLSSADMVFGDLLNQSLSWAIPDNPFAQFVLTAVFTWFCLTIFKLLLFHQDVQTPEAAPRAESKSRGFRLTMIEATMLLGSVDVMFLAFVLIQARYLFGGEANITAQGYTYAEYARRGFYELVAVSVMTIGLILALDAWTFRKRAIERYFRLLVGGLIVLTMVLLVAAFRRLNLYENAYGYTRIRVMSAVFMLWLALLLSVLPVAIVRRQHRVFYIASIIIALCFVLTLNLINMDGFIASRNIARFEQTGKLDVPYLLSLSDDAVPALADLVENPRLDENERPVLLNGLAWKLYNLDRDRAQRGTFGFHVGRERAWRALNPYRETLEEYIYPSPS
jgi:hypothetical protein